MANARLRSVSAGQVLLRRVQTHDGQVSFTFFNFATFSYFQTSNLAQEHANKSKERKTTAAGEKGRIFSKTFWNGGESSQNIWGYSGEGVENCRSLGDAVNSDDLRLRIWCHYHHTLHKAWRRGLGRHVHGKREARLIFVLFEKKPFVFAV